MKLQIALALIPALLPGAAGMTEQGSRPVGFAAAEGDGLGATTGGENGRVVTVSTFGDLERFAAEDLPCIIRVSGTISGSGMLRVGSNKTIIGDGSDAALEGFGLNISDAQNIIIRNLSFTGADDDAINVQNSSHHIWIDHCDFSNAYDGLVDIKRGASWTTVSWNRFSNHGKTCLLGHSDDNEAQDAGRLKVTYHHNWFDGTNSRHPRVRFGECHVFNNFYAGVTDYGIASTENAGVLVEANYFVDVDRPALVGFAGSRPGDLVERDNVFVNSGVPQAAGTVFDPSRYYPYAADPAADVPAIVRAGAGVKGFAPPAEAAFERRDCNGDGAVDIADPVALLLAIFSSRFEIPCQDACDSNDDGAADISDAIDTLGALFLGTGAPQLPGAKACGADLTPDALGCETRPANCR